MKRLSLAEVVKKPRFLVEFPLPGAKICNVDFLEFKTEGWKLTYKPKDSDPGVPTILGRVLKVGESYLLEGDQGIAEFKVVSSSQYSVGIESEEGFESIGTPKSALSIQWAKVRDVDFLSVPERIELQRVLGEIEQIKSDEDYNFLISFYDGADTIQARADRYLSASAEDKARISKSEELDFEILDWTRRQIEILAKLDEGALSDFPPESIYAIISAINSSDQDTAIPEVLAESPKEEIQSLSEAAS